MMKWCKGSIGGEFKIRDKLIRFVNLPRVKFKNVVRYGFSKVLKKLEGNPEERYSNVRPVLVKTLVDESKQWEAVYHTRGWEQTRENTRAMGEISKREK